MRWSSPAGWGSPGSEPSSRPDGPPASSHDLLGVAHRALPPPVEPVEPSEEVLGWMQELGLGREPDHPLLGSLTRAVADVRAAGVPLPTSAFHRYAEAARLLAAVDVQVATAAPSPAAAMHTVVVGTVMLDPADRDAAPAGAGGREREGPRSLTAGPDPARARGQSRQNRWCTTPPLPGTTSRR